MFHTLLFVITALSVSQAQIDPKDHKKFIIKIDKDQIKNLGDLIAENEDVKELIEKSLTTTSWEKSDNKFSLTFSFLSE